MFHLSPDGCKIVFNLENKNVFCIDFLNKNGIIGSSQNFNQYSWKTNKMIKLFAKKTF